MARLPSVLFHTVLASTGTFKHARAGRQHLATGDSRQTIRELGKTAYVTATDRKVLFKLIQKP